MIVQYSGTALNDNEAMVTFYGAARLYNSRGRAHILRRRMVIEGEIIGADTAAVDQRVAQIRSMFALDGGVCQLLKSDGSGTRFVIGNGAISGCRIVEGPTFMAQDAKAHYLTGLPFMVALEADELAYQLDGLVAYSETITQIGTGGPRRVVVELDNGLPVEQIVSESTAVTIIQAGEAVGIGSYPAFNQPIFHGYVDLPDGLQVSRGTPRMDGGTYLDYPVRWSYRMTSPTSIGIPDPILRN